MRAGIERADGEFESSMLQLVIHAASVVDERGRHPHWQAAAWLLERRWPQEYGRHVPFVARVEDPIAEPAVNLPPVNVPTVAERLAGILEVLDGAGKLPISPGDNR